MVGIRGNRAGSCLISGWSARAGLVRKLHLFLHCSVTLPGGVADVRKDELSRWFSGINDDELAACEISPDRRRPDVERGGEGDSRDRRPRRDHANRTRATGPLPPAAVEQDLFAEAWRDRPA